MLIDGLFLISIYILLRYVIAWVAYYNKTDYRFGDSIWRWTYDYPVKGKRDISDLDDKAFVRKRRIRNRTVTIMYSIFFLGFIVFMSFISNLLILILR